MPEEEKKTVDIDTSGPDTEINVPEEKEEAVVDTAAETTEQETVTEEKVETEKKEDEKLENYQELHNWITAIGFPEDRAEFKAFRKANSDRRPDSISKYDAKSDSPKPRTPDSAMYSDATLTILTNKNNPILNDPLFRHFFGRPNGRKV